MGQEQAREAAAEAAVEEILPTIGYPLEIGPYGGVGDAFRRKRRRPMFGIARLSVGEEPGRALHRAICRAYGVLPSTHGSMAGAAEAIGVARAVYVRLVRSKTAAHLFYLVAESGGIAPVRGGLGLSILVDSRFAIVCESTGLAKRRRAIAPIDLGDRSSRSVVSEAIGRIQILDSGALSPLDSTLAIASSEEGPGHALHDALCATAELPAGAYGAATVLAARLGYQVRAYNQLIQRGRLPGVLAVANRLGLALAYRYDRRRTPEWVVGPIEDLVDAAILALPTPW